MQLKITLDKTYKGGEKYTVYIDYISKPNEVKLQGSAAITDAKGLYFINPKGEIKISHTQIWTQGETESNSVWFPTIDKPNQKTRGNLHDRSVKICNAQQWFADQSKEKCRWNEDGLLENGSSACSLSFFYGCWRLCDCKR